MIRFLSNLRSAITSLREQRSRSILSALGIMVATTAIVLLVSIATGVRADVTQQVKDIGVNVLIVIPGRIEEGTFNPNLGGASYLKAQDARRLEGVKGVVRVTPWTFVGGGIRRGEKVANSILGACEANWFRMHVVNLQSGRVFKEGDEHSDVCVLGSIAQEAMFGKEQAVGKKVTINAREYTVIGVTEDKKSEQSLFSLGSFQNLVYIPYPRLLQIEPETQTHRIMIQIEPDAEPRALIKSLERVLGDRLDRQQYQVLTQEDLLGLVYKLMGILTWLLTGLTSIALFVGGVGIMTVMLMSVGERAKEIGIRKTTGARRLDIFLQFLCESVLLSLTGGAVGFGFSYGVCLLLYRFTPVKPMVTVPITLLSFSVSLIVGATFGLIPAMRAARQDPIVALRHE